MVVNELKLNNFHYISNMERQTESTSFGLFFEPQYLWNASTKWADILDFHKSHNT